MDDDLFDYYVRGYHAGLGGHDVIAILQDALSEVQSLRGGCERLLAITYGAADGRTGGSPASQDEFQKRLNHALMLRSGGGVEVPLERSLYCRS